MYPNADIAIVGQWADSQLAHVMLPLIFPDYYYVYIYKALYEVQRNPV